jgi:CDP-diacylglycerol--glycerol-3-phosphate 3-phosphatidyltransferase
MKLQSKIPNSLSIARIFASLVLLLLKPFTCLFFSIYIFCGISDIADGYLARKWKTNSSVGATLDSIADFIFTIIYFLLFIPLLKWEKWMIAWLIGIIVIRAFSLWIGYVKFHKLAFLHTYTNKITGVFMFLFPVFLYTSNGIISIAIVCAIASIASIEELLIIIKTKTLHKDCKGLFLNE